MKTAHGGKRKKAGRKPAADPKITVTVYIETSKVKAVGGYDKCRKLIVEFITAEALK